MTSQLDHLVIAAPDLETGVRWCEQTLGVTPATGGSHPLMGTHNRLVRLEGDRFEQAYLEIIAIDPHAKPERTSPLARWFDLDEPALVAALKRDGPQLIHWVVRTQRVRDAVLAWQAMGIERGQVLAASRMTANGLLSWQITVRDDGKRLFDGCLPTLIEWGDVHPAPTLPKQGVRLERLGLRHPSAQIIGEALAAIGLAGLTVEPGQAELGVQLVGPTGELCTLQSRV